MSRLLPRTGPIARLGLALCACVLLIACESKVSREKFDKVQVGMTLAQVEDLLGSGSDDTSDGGLTVNSAGVPDISKGAADKTYVWKAGSGRIVITFSKGKVVQKQATGL
jgi:hypothetical protein